MSLFGYEEQCCCTCRYWKGVRTNVRTMPGYVFCFKHLVGICCNGDKQQEVFPLEHCESWESMPSFPRE